MDLIQTRSRHQPASSTVRVRAKLLIVRVEEVFVSFIEGFVSGNMRRKNESFEEPSRVREVPFGGAGIGHGLQHLVLCRVRLCQLQALSANFLISRSEERRVGKMV